MFGQAAGSAVKTGIDAATTGAGYVEQVCVCGWVGFFLKLLQTDRHGRAGCSERAGAAS
jgi:hypothetical protein